MKIVTSSILLTVLALPVYSAPPAHVDIVMADPAPVQAASDSVAAPVINTNDLEAQLAHIKSIINSKPLSNVQYPYTFKLNAFESIDPISTGTYRTLKDITGGQANYEDNKWPSTPATLNEDINALLPNYSSSVITYKNSASSGLQYMTGSISAEKGQYRVVLDFIKYRDEPIVDSNNTVITYGRVGVGLRMIADLTTSKSELNLGSLMAIGLNAKAGNLKGSLYVDVIGISSPEITNLVPFTSVIDETSIQSALQALASIKAKLSDKDTRLTPHVVAVAKKEEPVVACLVDCKRCKKGK